MKKFPYLITSLMISLGLMALPVFGQESTGETGLIPVIESETTEAGQVSPVQTTEQEAGSEDKDPGLEESPASIQYETKEVPIPYSTIRNPNPSLAAGQERLVQEGRQGLKRVVSTYKLTLTEKKLIDSSEEIIQSPQAQIIEYGLEETTSQTTTEMTTEASSELTSEEETSSDSAKEDSQSSETSQEESSSEADQDSDDSKTNPLQPFIDLIKGNSNQDKEKLKLLKDKKNQSIKAKGQKAVLPATGESPIYFQLGFSLIGMAGIIILGRKS